MSLASIVGLFNIFVGVMLVIAFLLMFAGLVVWYIRLGTYPTYRDDAIDMMQWAVSIMFVLVVLLSVAQFVQQYTKTVLFLIGVAIVLGLAYFIMSELVLAEAPEEKKNH